MITLFIFYLFDKFQIGNFGFWYGIVNLIIFMFSSYTIQLIFF